MNQKTSFAKVVQFGKLFENVTWKVNVWLLFGHKAVISSLSKLNIDSKTFLKSWSGQHDIWECHIKSESQAVIRGTVRSIIKYQIIAICYSLSVTRPGKSCESSSSWKLRALQCPQNSGIRDNGSTKIYVLNVGVAWWNPQLLSNIHNGYKGLHKKSNMVWKVVYP